jgi:hypothetical protein
MPAFTSRRRHGGRWWGIGTTAAAAVVALLFVGLAGAAKPPSTTPSGPFPVPNGPLSVAAGFEGNDANLVAENAVPSGAPTNGGGYTINFDWNSLATNPTYLPAGDYGQVGNTTNGWKWLAMNDAQKSTTDTGFGGGVKQDDNCPAVIGTSAPNKDDLKRAYLAARTVNGHTYLELGWVRIPQNTTSSSAHIAFEFNQNDSTNACGGNSDGLVQRKAGDLLLLYDFTGGSTVPPDITMSRWIDSGTCGVTSHTAPCWGPFTDLEQTNPIAAEANVDTGLSHICNSTLSPTGCGPNETDINGAGAGTTYSLPSSVSDSLAPSTETLGASEFGEATVDLTNAGVFGSGQCVSFGQVEAVSRSSGDSGTAAMEDLVGPGTFTLSNCTTAVSTTPQSDGTGVTAGTLSDMTQDSTTKTWGTLTSGTWVADKATVTVTGTTTWSGTVAFYLCYSGTSTLTSCHSTDSNATHVTADKTLSVTNGVGSNVATSDATQVSAAGSYCWAAYFTASSPTGLPNGKSETLECFTVTAPTSIATNPWFYPQDRAVISASSGGNLAGSVSFKLYQQTTSGGTTTSAHDNCVANGDTVGSGGLVYKETGVSVSGASPQTVDTSNGSNSSTAYRITASTPANLYWRVTYTSTNTSQTGSSSVCVEYTGATINADGTVTFP